MSGDRTRRELLASLERDDLTVDELADRAETLLRELAPRQTRYKVRERPDVRTIRYYTAQSLLPKPVGYEGGRARYAGSHLLRLLLIKKLQAEHHTLKHIARVLRDADDQDVLHALLDHALDAPGSLPRPEPSAAAPVRAPAEAPARAPAEVPAHAPAHVPAHVQAHVPGGTPTRRFTLARGASVDVPEAVLADPAQRSELVTALESLARALRDPGQGEES